jgi:hypothetical protein
MTGEMRYMTEHGARVRILSDYSLMPIWVERESKKVYADWYGDTVEIGSAHFSEEEDTWMFQEADGLDYCKAPEGRYTLSDEMDDGLADEIDNAINENMGEWFKHPCDIPSKCKHSEHYEYSEHECEGCSRNDEQIRGKDHFDYGDHCEPEDEEDDA